MEYFQMLMIANATAMLVITLGLLMMSTMPLRPGLRWWAAASFLQFVKCIPAYLFFGQEKTDLGLISLFVLLMVVYFSISLGTLLFVGTNVNVRKRLLTLVAGLFLVAGLILSGQVFTAELVFAFFCAFVTFEAAYYIWHLKGSGVLLRLSSFIYIGIGIHSLDFLVLSKVEWFIPVGFLISMFLFLGLCFTLAAITLLEFTKALKASEARAISSATHDPLTGLYNRAYLKSLFTEYKSEVGEGKNSFLLLYLDLDGFKAVNDTYGHHAGDLVLTVIAKRLKRWLGKKGDAIRIGGDELVIMNRLRSGVDVNSDIVYGTSAAQSVLELIEKPIVDVAGTYKVSASIGCCYYSSEYSDLESMLNKADKLMYSAKKEGGQRVNFENIPDVLPLAKQADVEVTTEMAISTS